MTGEFGTAKLEEFKQNDQGIQNMEKRAKNLEEKAKRLFEKDIIGEAQEYILKAQSRLKQQMLNVQEDHQQMLERIKREKA